MFGIEKEMKEINVVQKQIAEAMSFDTVMKMYDILRKDTTNVAKNQLKKHIKLLISCVYEFVLSWMLKFFNL